MRQTLHLGASTGTPEEPQLVVVARNGMATGIKGNTHDFVVMEHQTLCSQ